MQRFCDSYRSPAHSSATTVTSAYLMTEKSHKTKTDEELKGEANKLLENYRFLFEDTSSKDPRVSHYLIIKCIG